MKKTVIAVIGAGASGLCAAISAAREADMACCCIKTVVFEALPRVGKKILATGNGRCNLANSEMSARCYSGDAGFISRVFSVCSAEDNLGFFRSIGLYTYSDSEGRIYPLSNRASSVLDALRFEAERLGVEFNTENKITSLKKSGGGFLLNGSFHADCVIVACGGMAAPKQGSDGSGFELLRTLGISVTRTVPALVGLVPDKSYKKSLRGVRAAAEIRLLADGKETARERGEVQFNENSISGIPVMQVSGVAAELKDRGRRVELMIDKTPLFSLAELSAYVRSRVAKNPGLSAENLFSGIMVKQLYLPELAVCSISAQTPIGELSDSEIELLCKNVKTSVFGITGTCGFSEAQVTRGGTDTSQFSPDTLECFNVPGLYACGEILNVDGICGGYNLQWAWSTGRLAGMSAVKSLLL